MQTNSCGLDHLIPFGGHREGAHIAEGRINPRKSRQFIAVHYGIVCGLSSLLKVMYFLSLSLFHPHPLLATRRASQSFSFDYILKETML